MTLLSIILLCIPTALPIIFEVFEDQFGDFHPNTKDVKIRVLMCFMAGFAVAVIQLNFDAGLEAFLINILQGFILSGCVFIFAFNYIINYVHLKRGVTSYKVKNLISGGFLHFKYRCLFPNQILSHIVNHLSDSAIPDKWPIWRKLGWKGRLIVNALVLTAGIIVYNL